MSSIRSRKQDRQSASASPYYFNVSHWRAMDGIVAGVAARKGLMMVTGPTGSGKTTVLREVVEKFDESVVHLTLQYTNLNFTEFVNFLHKSLNVAAEVGDAKNRAVALRQFLTAQAERGETSVLFIDEAHNLEPDVFRMLPKLAVIGETESGTPIGMQFVLGGDETLPEHLEDADFAGVRAAMADHFELKFFTRDEMALFLDQRLAPIAKMTDEPISPDAVDRVAHYTNGSPRLLGMICSHAMLFAAEDPGKQIDAKMIDEAAEALMMKPAENAFAHDTEVEDGLAGPLAGSDFDNEDETIMSSIKEKIDPAAALEDDAPKTGLFAKMRASEPVEEDLYDDDTYEDDLYDDEFDDEDEDDDKAAAKPSAFASLIDSARAAFRRGSADDVVRTRRAKPATADDLPEDEDRPSAPVARRPRGRVVGRTREIAKSAALVGGVAVLAAGAYVIREPVANAASGLVTAAQTQVAALTGEGGLVDSLPDSITPALNEGWARQAQADAPVSEDRGWGAKVVLSATEPAGGVFGTEWPGGDQLPPTVANAARGALDVAEGALNWVAQGAPKEVRDLVDVAANDVSELRGRVAPTDEKTQSSEGLAELVEQGNTHFAAGRFVAPRGENAYASYRAVLEVEPEHPDAKAGIERLRDLFAQRAQSAREAKQWAVANENFERAIAIGKLRPIL